jgi:hypothetical protein
MNQSQFDLLEKCIEQMNAGVALEDCINQSMELTPEMTEILKTSRDLMSLGENQVSKEQMKRSLATLLTKAESLKAEEANAAGKRGSISFGMRIRALLTSGGAIRPLLSRMALVMGITALLILLSGGLVITSAKSLPGDSLYPVKRAVEDISVYLVPSKEIRQEYEVSYSQQRVDEVKRLIALNRIQAISFEGVVEVNSSTDWTVSGIPVMIQGNTSFVGEIKGSEPFVNGSVVEVEGVTNLQGAVTANEIHLRQYQFTGMVERIDKNSWQISGINVAIKPNTLIGEGIEVGDEVEVIIRSEDDGLYALSIQNNNNPTSTPLIDNAHTNDPTAIGEATENQENETHDAITTPEVEEQLESGEAGDEELKATAEPDEGGEHEDSSNLAPTETHETENHDQVATPTPEQHQSTEETGSHD